MLANCDAMACFNNEVFTSLITEAYRGCRVNASGRSVHVIAGYNSA